MRTLIKDAFLEWTKARGIRLDPQYPAAAVLTYGPDSDSRFWEVPAKPERRPYFIKCLIELMGEWQTCFVWKPVGSWPDARSVHQERMNEVVGFHIMQGLGLSLGNSAIVEFDRRELGALVTLLFSTSVFGRSTGDDLYIVPDHARQILKTDHHNVIHAQFRDATEAESWVSRMSKFGFGLPEDLPDATFKRPGWMRGKPRPSERGGVF